MEMDLLEFNYNTDDGFAWIMLEDGNIVQCLLHQPVGSNPQEKIIMSDCGHLVGMCADSNEEAFRLWGENRCMKALFAKAKEAGLTVNE